MTEYQKLAGDFEHLGVGLAALSVDRPERSRALAESLGLSFPLLCDPARSVVGPWGLVNRLERQVSYPATFFIDTDRKLLFASAEGTYSRVAPRQMLDFVRAWRESSRGSPPKRRFALPGVRDLWHSSRNVLRFGMRSPRS